MTNNPENIAHKPYKQILKSTFIMGGSSLIVTMLGIVRTKFIALILGPAGVGLTGVFMNMANLVTIFSCMGIGDSGVRQIAGNSGTGDLEKVARTALGIRRVTRLFGLAGLCLLFFLRNSISRLSFGTPDHSQDIAILSATVFFGAISAGQIALIQGTRRIGDLAKLNIFGALLGTLLSIPIIYTFGEKGIVYILFTVSATAVFTSWWYSHKIKLPEVHLNWRDSLCEAKPLVKLGAALMLGSLMSLGSQFVLRVFVVRSQGMDAAGIYHAATALSLVYIGVILNAMMTDFYPRLAAAAHDHEECRSLINSQAEVGLLLVVPGILAIMTFAPLVIVLFYSSKFTQAAEILRWQMLGGMLQAVTWPMGCMLRAKGNGKLVLWTETCTNCIHLSLAWLGLTYFGLPGIGMSFFGKDFFYMLLMYRIVRKNYNFTFIGATQKIFIVFALATGLVFLVPNLVPKEMQLFVNAGITVVAGIYSFRTMVSRARIDMVPGFLFRLKARFGF